MHRTTFDLDTGEVVGPWCPYPPVLGSFAGLITKNPNPNFTQGEGKTLGRFEVKTGWKDVFVRIQSDL